MDPETKGSRTSYSRPCQVRDDTSNVLGRLTAFFQSSGIVSRLEHDGYGRQPRVG